MSLSINDILKDLGHEEDVPETPSVPNVESAAPAVPEVEKISAYLEELAKPDTIIDELAKLAVLQDWVKANNIEMDKIASYQFEFKDDEKSNMLKTASQLITDLSNEVQALKGKEEKRAQAENIATKMASSGHITYGEILEKVAELVEQPQEELRAIERALELTKTSSRLGSLSTSHYDSGNSLLNYILNG